MPAVVTWTSHLTRLITEVMWYCPRPVTGGVVHLPQKTRSCSSYALLWFNVVANNSVLPRLSTLYSKLAQ